MGSRMMWDPNFDSAVDFRHGVVSFLWAMMVGDCILKCDYILLSQYHIFLSLTLISMCPGSPYVHWMEVIQRACQIHLPHLNFLWMSLVSLAIFYLSQFIILEDRGRNSLLSVSNGGKPVLENPRWWSLKVGCALLSFLTLPCSPLNVISRWLTF